MTKLRRSGAVLAGLCLAAGLLVAAEAPAQAAPGMHVCNSSASDTVISVYVLNGGAVTVPPGECGFAAPDFNVRVNVITKGSYKLGEIGGGYGPCHNAPNSASNPADSWDWVRYRTYLNEGC